MQGQVLYNGSSGKEISNYFTPSIEHAKSFGNHITSVVLPSSALVFDINNEIDFNKLLHQLNNKVHFAGDNTVFHSFHDFTNHNSGSVGPAEANNSWMVEEYYNLIGQMGFDVAKFMDGGYESFLLVSDRIKAVIKNQMLNEMKPPNSYIKRLLREGLLRTKRYLFI